MARRSVGRAQPAAGDSGSATARRRRRSGRLRVVCSPRHGGIQTVLADPLGCQDSGDWPSVAIWPVTPLVPTAPLRDRLAYASPSRTRDPCS
jgi:hypothetical protein